MSQGQSEKERKFNCFIIQQFDDNGAYDRRYYETIKPTLEKVGVAPKRADEILGQKPIIDKIEHEIRNSDFCVAEVSENNPNVWLEIGYGYSLRKPTILLCDKNKRNSLPFDVQHRPVIFYHTDYKSGFEELEKRLISEVKEIIKELTGNKATLLQEPLQNITNVSAELDNDELLILSILLSGWTDDPSGTSTWKIKNEASGYRLSDIDTSLVLANLEAGGFIEKGIDTDYNGNEFNIFKLTPFSISWIQRNSQAMKELSQKIQKNNNLDDEIPF